MDNREAKIVVGQKIPLIVQDVAGNPVSQLQTIGIQLKVTPHLTQDKKIIMDLHPEVSDLVDAEHGAGRRHHQHERKPTRASWSTTARPR